MKPEKGAVVIEKGILYEKDRTFVMYFFLYICRGILY
jgi:hypothetical protein